MAHYPVALYIRGISGINITHFDEVLLSHSGCESGCHFMVIFLILDICMMAPNRLATDVDKTDIYIYIYIFFF